jgi:hypothetical protein
LLAHSVTLSFGSFAFGQIIRDVVQPVQIDFATGLRMKYPLLIHSDRLIMHTASLTQSAHDSFSSLSVVVVMF